MRIQITVDTVRAEWEIYIRDDNRSITTTGKTQEAALDALKDAGLVQSVRNWLRIGQNTYIKAVPVEPWQ